MTCQRAQDVDLAEFLAEPDAPSLDGFRRHYPGCADCSAAVAEWHEIEMQLAGYGADETPSTDSAHTETAMLASYADVSALGNAERDAVRAHLDGCAECRLVLRSLQDFDFARIGVTEADMSGLADILLKESAAKTLGDMDNPAQTFGFDLTQHQVADFNHIEIGIVEQSIIG